MDTQFNEKRHGGRIFRPAVIPRPVSEGIANKNFSLKCKGMVGTKVLEVSTIAKLWAWLLSQTHSWLVG